MPLSRIQAIEFTGLDAGIFDNYFKNAGEFTNLPRPNNRGRFFFNQEELERWLEGYRWRKIELTFEDYALCLDFALAQHFRNYVLSDWGTGRQREFGQKITNWIRGQLAEVAVKKFLKREFNLDVQLDFEIHEEIVPQDIITITKNGNQRRPRIGVGIKSTKPKNAYLILGENEVTHEDRRSDIYILCRPDIPDDHLLRITKDKIIEIVENEQHYPSYRNEIPDFGNTFCEIAGWCRIEELQVTRSVPGQEFSGERHVKKSGELHKNRESWQELVSLL